MRSVMMFGAGAVVATGAMFAAGMIPGDVGTQDPPGGVDFRPGERAPALDVGTQDPPGGVDMEAMMAEYAKFATPGAAHEQLMRLRGSWDLTVEFRMAPDGPWMESKSAARCRPMIGNRFMSQHIEGGASEMMPEGYEGYGIMGYDTARKVYQQAWMDDHGTMMMFMEGTGNEDGTQITLEGSYDDPVMGSKMSQKWVYTIESDDKILFEMYHPDPATGEVYQMGKITYTRAANTERRERGERPARGGGEGGGG